MNVLLFARGIRSVICDERLYDRHLFVSQKNLVFFLYICMSTSCRQGKVLPDSHSHFLIVHCLGEIVMCEWLDEGWKSKAFLKEKDECMPFLSFDTFSFLFSLYIAYFSYYSLLFLLSPFASGMSG